MEIDHFFSIIKICFAQAIFSMHVFTKPPWSDVEEPIIPYIAICPLLFSFPLHMIITIYHCLSMHLSVVSHMFPSSDASAVHAIVCGFHSYQCLGCYHLFSIVWEWDGLVGCHSLSPLLFHSHTFLVGGLEQYNHWDLRHNPN